MGGRSNVVADKSRNFSKRIVKLCVILRQDRHEFTISAQLIRSGTSVGANISEAVYAQSRADFISKMHIALKEINESGYWIDLLHTTNFLSDVEYKSIFADQQELVKLLTAIVKTARNH